MDATPLELVRYSDIADKGSVERLSGVTDGAVRAGEAGTGLLSDGVVWESITSALRLPSATCPCVAQPVSHTAAQRQTIFKNCMDCRIRVIAASQKSVTRCVRYKGFQG